MALVLAVHHIVCDRWTLRLISRDLMAFYCGLRTGEPVSLPPLPVSYTENCAWETEVYAAAREANLAYWKAALSAAPALSMLPAPPSGEVFRPSGEAGRREDAPRAVATAAFLIDAATVGQLKVIARQLRATPFMLYAAVYGCVLGRFADQADVVFGTQVSSRLRPEAEQLAGFFVNTLPVRMRVGDDATFSDAVAGVKAAVLGAVDHQVIPLEDIVAESGVSRVAGRHPLFQTVFQLLTTPAWGAEAEGVDILSALVEDPQFDLMLELLGRARRGDRLPALLRAGG